MLATRKNKAPRKSQARVLPRAALRDIEHVASQMGTEDAKLKLPLLDAAVAGIVLGFKPDHREMRRQAAHAWAALKTTLLDHIVSEDETLVPWAESLPQFPREVLDRLAQRTAELRHIVQKIGATNFERDADEAVANAGAALTLLAVKLDDLIESEEINLLPTVRRAIFAAAPEATDASETAV